MQPLNPKIINAFLEKNPDSKKVLRLKNNHLSIVPISQTSLLERIQCWFGFGSLSMRNIVKFLANERAIQGTDERTNEFLRKVITCARHYNSSHLRKVQASALLALEIKTNGKAIALKDTTYQPGDLDGNVDFSYVNQALGFGFVVDGAGHNNPIMKTVLGDILSKFIRGYEARVRQTKFSSIEEYQDFVFKELTRLGQDIKSDEREVRPGRTFDILGLEPGISFVQIVNLEDKRFLLSFQVADGMIIIQKADDTFDTSLIPSPEAHIRHQGLGDPSSKPSVTITELEPGDRVFGFTDGIGEFLTMDECQEILLENTDPETIFSEMKAKIIAKGKDWPDDEETRSENTPSANNGKSIKYHHPDYSAYHDDISMFMLP